MPDKSSIVCDDHPLFRSGVVHCLEQMDDMKVVAQASDVQSAIAKLQIYTPDFLICDLSMPDQSGFNLLKWVQSEMPKVKSIVLSMHTGLAFVQKAQSLGAIGFLAKEDAEFELFYALKQSCDGFYTSESVGKDTSNTVSIEKEDNPFVDALAKVSAAEMRVLCLLSQSMTNKQIAETLNISPRTVEAHRLNLAVKLDAKGPNKLLEMAIRHHDIIRLRQ